MWECESVKVWKFNIVKVSIWEIKTVWQCKSLKLWNSESVNVWKYASTDCNMPTVTVCTVGTAVTVCPAYHSCYREKSIFPSYKGNLNLTLFSVTNLIIDAYSYQNMCSKIQKKWHWNETLYALRIFTHMHQL